MPELRATARLQLHRAFTLRDAAEQVPYYAGLGISHLYLSPISTARPGSMHGYDVIDHGRVNPELGGEDALRELVAALRRHDMGCLLDIVPNHMAADPANPWWRDVLARGRQSPHADFFDIDWDAPGHDGRLLLPVLAAGVDAALRDGTLRPALDPHGRGIGLACNGQRLPLSAAGLAWLLGRAGLPQPDSHHRDAWREAMRATLAQPAGRAALQALLGRLDQDARAGGNALRELLDRQHYRLAWWRRGNDELNYRRFFDISELAAVRVERAEVFEAVHALPLRLVAEGLADGLRIDHVDGLAAPRAYLRRLRRRLDAAASERPGSLRGHVPIYVEKILAHGERLPAGWPVDGSTGYDFMDQAGALLHDPAGEAPLRRAWACCDGGREADYEGEERRARRYLLGAGLHAEFAACVRAWHALAAHAADGREFTAHALGCALAEILEQVRVYRSYLGPAGAGAADRAALEPALAAADRHGDPDRADARAWLRGQLLDHPPCAEPPGPARRRRRLALRRFEQLAAPLNAKAVEDTVFYRCGVLLSRNEVGSDPRHLALAPEAFHQAMRQRATGRPCSLLATATHDHKRGEDTRARLAVLSERAEWFAARALDWIARLHAGADMPAPASTDLWMLLQTVLAAWPLELGDDDAPGLAAYAGRLADWQRKALREAKLRSRWTAPDEAYEAACRRALDHLFADPALRGEVAGAARSLDAPGALNGLVQCALKLTAPGVSDLYQGCERWDQSLVDPDNRRPVDYALRRAGPPADARPEALLRDYRTGAAKQWQLARLLDARRRHPEVFLHGDYQPLALRGRHAARAVAFVRRHGNECWLVVLPRLAAGWLAGQALPQVPPAAWADTALQPPDDAPCTWHGLFTGITHRAGAQGLPLAVLLGRWPLAVLRRQR